MCGRFTLTEGIEEIARRFAIDQYNIHWDPRYNIAPSQEILIITNGILQKKNWGIPLRWNPKRRLINKRLEKIEDMKRCLIPADGFYEWVGKKPYRIITRSGLFAFAGVYDGVDAAIVTTEANEKLIAIHERMPLILSQDSEGKWLKGAEVEPPGSDHFDYYLVTSKVNSWKNDSSDLIDRR